MNQKEIKALKKQVQEESAFNVGFNAGLPVAILKQNEDLWLQHLIRVFLGQ